MGFLMPGWARGGKENIRNGLGGNQVGQHFMLCRRRVEQGQRGSVSRVSWKPRKERARRTVSGHQGLVCNGISFVF